MSPLSILLVAASLLVLMAGLWAWKLTSSRPLVINVLISSAFLLVGAYAAKGGPQADFAFVLPFFAAMLLGGRAIGLIWRSRKDVALRTPGLLLVVCAVLCATGAFSAWYR